MFGGEGSSLSLPAAVAAESSDEEVDDDDEVRVMRWTKAAARHRNNLHKPQSADHR